MLEGNEVDIKFDNNAGEVTVDVDTSGNIAVGVTYAKDIDSWVKPEVTVKVSTNIITVLEKIAAKTSATWDDAAVASIKKILNITT